LLPERDAVICRAEGERLFAWSSTLSPQQKDAESQQKRIEASSAPEVSSSSRSLDLQKPEPADPISSSRIIARRPKFSE
jgi:hypothetical protein